MYIFKNKSGELVPAPDNFNPENPDLQILGDVEEVLYVSKVLVKQVRFVVKSQEERKAVRKARTKKQAE